MEKYLCLLHNIIFERFNHSVVYNCSSFSLLYSVPIHELINSIFIVSNIDGHLNDFRFMNIMNSAATNIPVYCVLVPVCKNFYEVYI